MIPFIVLMPLAVAGGGLIGLAQERFRRKRLVTQLSCALDSSNPDVVEELDAQVMMASGDILQVKYSERAARLALGVSAVGLYYPPFAVVSMPIIGYSIYNWLRTRYLFEQPWFKSPLSVLAMLALAGALVTGHMLMASLVLVTDLAARKWIANWTKGARLIDGPNNNTNTADTADTVGNAVMGSFTQRVRRVLRVVLQGEPRWEWFPALLARVSMGLFFAISGWNKLFTVAHWKGLMSAMIATGLPFPKLMSMFLASIELFGGSLLTIGFMSTFFSIALAFAMIIAIVTFEIPYVIPPGLGPLDWLDWFLYLPQVLYVLIFLWLIIKGPGPYSVDAVIARKLGVDKDPEKDRDKDHEKDPDIDSGLSGVAQTPDLLPA